MCVHAVLADRVQALRADAREDAAREALAVFAPLANRLGVWSLKAELEDLAFKVRCALGTFAITFWGMLPTP